MDEGSRRNSIKIVGENISKNSGTIENLLRTSRTQEIKRQNSKVVILLIKGMGLDIFFEFR